MAFFHSAAILVTLLALPCPIHAGFLSGTLPFVPGFLPSPLPSFPGFLPPPLPSVPIPLDDACRYSPYPSFCRTMLPAADGPRDLHDYGRLSLARSLAEAWSFSSMIDGYLLGRSALSPEAVRALEDCRLLADLNIDFLEHAGAAVNSSAALPGPQADQLDALLSAIITNQDTCLDGLAASGESTARSGLRASISTCSKHFSVSLALYSRAWLPHGPRAFSHGGFFPGRPARLPKRGRRLLFHGLEEVAADWKQGLPLRLSGPDRELYEGRSGRRLLQSTGDVVVSSVVVVDKNGTGNFTTINDAINSAPNKTKSENGYYMIYVVAGVYEEYISVPKNKRYLMLVGDGINRTIITGNRSVADGWTTFNSATVAVVGEGFVAAYLTIRNTAGAAKHQAVALRCGADLSAFYSCSFEGYQDTLYTHSLRQFYRECDIYGTVDFIFGNAAVVFQNCNIYPRLPLRGQTNTITAQGRSDPNQNTGTSIQNCTFLATPDLNASSTKTYFGRPWRVYSRTVIMHSYLDTLINPAGWLQWDNTSALTTLYYAEYNNWGPGNSTAKRVSWPGYHVIGATDAANFTASSFLAGDSWLPRTGIPYQSGLAA